MLHLTLALSAFVTSPPGNSYRHESQPAARAGDAPRAALGIDLKGQVAFVAGVADSSGYGWSIVKALTEAGATVAVGTWPPVLGMFEKSLKMGKLDDDLVLSDGSKMQIPKIYPLCSPSLLSPISLSLSLSASSLAPPSLSHRSSFALASRHVADAI
jgi:hypothetical protein